ncbi:MAG: hypothetical protein U0L98_06695 [Clostridia bacterium]|nr:hypothetical protein [Clostridia bacterium]
MENASKALIIAGAILLAILIISLGILIFSQAQDTVGTVNMSEQEIMAFNNKFITYQGNNKRGTEVNALLKLVNANNQAANDSGATEKIIECSFTPHYISLGLHKNGFIFEGTLPDGSMWNVNMYYEKGLINAIKIIKADQ